MIWAQEIEIGTLGMGDSLILMVLALVVFGPRRLPQIGRQLGKLMYEFRKASNDFKFQMEEELRLSEEADRRKKLEDDRLQREAAAKAQPEAPAQPEMPAPAVDPEPRILPPSTGQIVAARGHLAEAPVKPEAVQNVEADQHPAEAARHDG